jgi:thioredoxin reductase (NADPH)
VVAIEGRHRVETVVLRNHRTNDDVTVEVEAILANLGYDSSLSVIRSWGVQLAGAGVQVDSMMQTSRPGIFAAGDIASYPGKLKLIATGFGEAAIAVNHAKRHIDPSANLFPGHSTSVAPQRFGSRLSAK